MELLQPYLNVIVMTLIVVAALVIAILIYKLFTGRVRGRKGTRLGITEYYEIDKLRRLVLVRRDGVEHLMLIGGNQDVVIESNISEDMDEDEAPAPQMRAAPRPAVFGNNRPPLRPVSPTFDPRNGRE
jgi:Flagellar biosynthesis protein, FliO